MRRHSHTESEQDMVAVPWAVIEDVTTLTGVTVDETTFAIAVVSIELTSGLIMAVERIDVTDRDRYFLKLAVCFQAAWLATQYDYLQRVDMASVSQDGQSISLKPDALVLAPLARRALKRLSWRGIHSIVTDLTPAGLVRGTIDPLSDRADDFLGWRPI